jgi:hypothetical protein
MYLWEISHLVIKIQGESESLNRRTDNTMAKKQKDKQGSTKHYTENRANMNPTLNQGMNADAEYTWYILQMSLFLS